MQKFKSTGYWHLPNQSDKHLVGTLEYDDDLSLSVIGTFSGFSGTLVTEAYPLILGVVDENPSGRFVSLLKSFQTSQTFRMPGFETQKFSPRMAIIGHSVLDEIDPKFTGFYARYSYLHNWFDVSSFSGDWLKEEQNVVGYASTFRKPMGFDFEYRGKRLRVTSSLAISQPGRAVTLREKLFLVMDDVEPGNVESLASNYAWELQNLISFAANEASTLLDLDVLSGPAEASDDRAKFSVYRKMVLTPKEEQKDLSRDDMLFTFTDTKNCGFDVFKAWGEFSQRFTPFCHIYFSHQAAPSKFLDDKFMRCLFQFGIFFRQLGLVDSRAVEMARSFDTIESTIQPQREWLRAMIPDAAALSLPSNLWNVLSANAEIMQPILNQTSEEFVDAIMRTFVFSARREEHLEVNAARKESLYYMIKRLNVLLQVCILREIGFSVTWINEIFSKNSEINHLKAVDV